jgi:molecular chaperone DnaJ
MSQTGWALKRSFSKKMPNRISRTALGQKWSDLPMNRYRVLGLARSATGNEVKLRFRQLAMQLHPDKNPDADATDRFSRVNQMYQCLSDANLRQKYDEDHDDFDTGTGDISGMLSGSRAASDRFRQLING